jgi:hypothetical protein
MQLSQGGGDSGSRVKIEKMAMAIIIAYDNRDMT